MSEEYNEPKVKKCNQVGCELPATHTLVWSKHEFYCPIHVNKALAVAQVMGFPTPANTVRKLEPLEMIEDDSDEKD